MKQLIAEIISNRLSTTRGATNLVFTIWLKAREIAVEAKPGQFVMVNCGQGTLLPRPFSIHRVDGDKISIFYRISGIGSDLFSLMRKGDFVSLFGPLGNGFSISPGAKNILLVAGGIGIAPLYFLAEQAAMQGLSVTIIYGTADEHRLSLPDGIEQIAVTDDGSVGHRGLVTDLLPEYAKKTDQIFACGPVPMYRTMAKMPSLKNKSVQVSLEIVMGCGRGVCYGCTIKTKSGLKKVCEDGPVFEMKDIIWDGPVTF